MHILNNNACKQKKEEKEKKRVNTVHSKQMLFSRSMTVDTHKICV